MDDKDDLASMVRGFVRVLKIPAQIQALLDQGRTDEARKLAQKHLRAGYGERQFLALIADMLEPKVARGRGRPKTAVPPKLPQIMDGYKELKDAGMSDEAAFAELAEKHGRSASSIRDAVTFGKRTAEKMRRIIRGKLLPARDSSEKGSPTK